MTSLLLLGLSDIAQRRVLPACERSPEISDIEIASASATHWSRCEGISKVTEKYPDYETALRQSKSPLVYISLTNDAHGRFANRALDAGKHVIVDKPCCTSLEETISLAESARQKNLCVAEALVYSWHPQFQTIRDVFLRYNDEPMRCSALFSFPTLAKSNFRTQRAHGGGALWDLGPYAASIGRVLFGEDPVSVSAQSFLPEHEEVESHFGALLTYSRARTIQGIFGWGASYQNSLELIGSEISIRAQRCFSISPDYCPELFVTHRAGQETIRCKAGDTFQLFIEEVVRSISANTFDLFRSTMLRDAKSLTLLRDASTLHCVSDPGGVQ